VPGIGRAQTQRDRQGDGVREYLVGEFGRFKAEGKSGSGRRVGERGGLKKRFIRAKSGLDPFLDLSMKAQTCPPPAFALT